jgi:DNA-binding protein HU-beta
MNKGDLIEKIVSEVNITKADAQRVLESIVDGITQSLKRGERTTISGFGTFSVSKRKARVGRNPQTGEPINIPARRVARFTAGKELREELEH